MEEAVKYGNIMLLKASYYKFNLEQLGIEKKD
jgi:hypothetical protein